MLIALAAVLCGFVWGAIHGQVWLQLNVRLMARAARSLQGVRKRPNRRLEAGPPTSFTAPQKFLAALFGTIVTGGILVVLASDRSVLALYPIGLFAGFSPALIQTYWRASALVGGMLLIGAASVVLYDEEDGPGDSGEHARVSELSGGQELPNQDARALPSPSLPLPSVEKRAAIPQEAIPQEAVPQEKEYPEEIILPGIPFAFNDQTIRPEFLTELNEAVRILNANPHISVLIEGYSDAVGPEEVNQIVSHSRAEAVRDYLVASGIAADRLRVVGRGEIDPLAPNAKDDGSDNPAGRAMNRRVELSVE